METKQCIKCQETKELSEFSIRRYPNNHVSYRGECKQCVRSRQQKYHLEHQEEIKEWHKSYYQKKKEILKKKNDDWWDKNREKMNQLRKKKRQEKLIAEIPKVNEEDMYKNWI